MIYYSGLPDDFRIPEATFTFRYYPKVVHPLQEFWGKSQGINKALTRASRSYFDQMVTITKTYSRTTTTAKDGNYE